MTTEARVINLPPRSEWRFELENGEKIWIRAHPRGDADVFGAELVPGADRWYPFGGEAKAAVSTTHGTSIDVKGTPSTEYVAEDISPSPEVYSNIHLALEQHRLLARAALRANGGALIKQLADAEWARLSTLTQPQLLEGDLYTAEGQGPRVLVVGGEAAGKTSVAKRLANYALRSPALTSTPNVSQKDSGSRSRPGQDDGDAHVDQITGWWPTIVSLDPSTGAIPLPGTVSSVPLAPVPLPMLSSTSPALPFGVFGQTTGYLVPSAAVGKSVAPLTLWYGHKDPRENEAHLRRVIEHLARATERRLARDPRARMSGLIIDTPGVITADGRAKYPLIQHIAKTFHVDVILVLGHEKLNIELTRALPGTKVVKIPKSEGVVELDELYNERVQDLQIHNYFYGTPAEPNTGGMEGLGDVPDLRAFSSTLSLDLLEVYRVGQGKLAPTSALPIGTSRTVTATQLTKLDPANEAEDQNAITNNVLALLQPPRDGGGPGKKDSEVDPPPSDEELIAAPVLGFVAITGMDAAAGKMTVLSPMSGKLPSKTAMVGDLDWQDS